MSHRQASTGAAQGLRGLFLTRGAAARPFDFVASDRHSAQPMKRSELDALAAFHALGPHAIETALRVTRAQPTRPEVTRFAARVLSLAGVLSIAAGVVFFVAANWDAFATAARFAAVETAIAAAAAAAFWRPPPHALGRGALLVAFIATGALLALFGQTYQTGADVYELFATWTLLGAAFVVAAQWSVVSAAWLFVLNVALLIYCGARPEGGLFWMVFGSWGMLSILLVPCALNGALWLVSQRLERTRAARYAPAWLARIALMFAIAFATWAGMAAIFGLGSGPAEAAAVLACVLALLGGLTAHTLRRRADVFPLAAAAGSAIALTSAALLELSDFDALGSTFTLAVWLVASSAVTSHWLMKLVRAWHVTEPRA